MPPLEPAPSRRIAAPDSVALTGAVVLIHPRLTQPRRPRTRVQRALEQAEAPGIPEGRVAALE